jgi:hypothetical protein
MASATEVRHHAIGEGKATARGKLSNAVITAWNTTHPDDPYEPDPPRDGFTGNQPDYPDADFDAQFPDVPGEGDGLGDTGETRPSRPKSSRSRTGTGGSGGGVRSFFRRGSSKSGAKKKTVPRVSTEDLLGSVWRGAAKLLTPLPPLQRTLRMQAPVAGSLLDDVVQGTIVDPLLQPLARLASQGKAVQALVGPPAFVAAIMTEQMRSVQNERQPNPFYMAIATEGLRSSLMAWMDVAGPKFEEAMEREALFEEKYGKRVDDMIALIFSQPPDSEEAVQAEEDAIRRAQGIL